MTFRKNVVRYEQSFTISQMKALFNGRLLFQPFPNPIFLQVNAIFHQRPCKIRVISIVPTIRS
ncbi:hypothetical protein DESC_660150 [Desulfosarcina cetonica]|nr:hypothetical protein DESC_660150 [Desulfosarcina cetonica]